jgi:hypothetical protein
VHLFWTQFTPQMPVMHAPTWTPAEQPDYLLAAMRACGALHVRTRRAGRFIMDTLAAARARLNAAFAAPLPGARAQNALFLSVALLQAVGMFHQEEETRASHLSFQGMLVQVRAGCFAASEEWEVDGAGR